MISDKRGLIFSEVLLQQFENRMLTAKKESDIMKDFKKPDLSPGIYIIVGGYGSGKSEVAVNLARFLADNRKSKDIPVAIADLDIVNPYFRSREAIETLKNLGIKSIVPEGSHFHADLPIIVPQIKGAVLEHDGYVILDVGGDDVGARVLSSLANAFSETDYNLFLVLNQNRPFTADLASTKTMIEKIEESSRLKFNGIISNTHLMDYTTAETIEEGYKFANDVSKKLKLPLMFVSGEKKILNKCDDKLITTPVLPLDRLLLKPWEKR